MARRWAAALRRCAAITTVAASYGVAQAPVTGSAILVGQTIRKESGQPLGYSVVAVPSLSRQVLTNDLGGFTIRNLPAGPLLIRFKHIGNAPRDTIVTLRDNDTLRVQIALAVLLIQLPAMHISGACGDKRPDERSAGILGELFDQVQQNADRYRLLADSNPFELIIQRLHGVRKGEGKIQATSLDTVTRGPFPVSPYVPRHLIRSREKPEGGIQHFLAVPELADYADTAFVNNHCFTYAGQRMFDGDSVIAVDFEPVPSLKGEVDFRGTMYVRADGYQLIRAEMELTRVPSELRSSGMTGMSVATRFGEIVPGVPTIERLESVQRYRALAPRLVEIAQVLDVKWVKGPP